MHAFWPICGRQGCTGFKSHCGGLVVPSADGYGDDDGWEEVFPELISEQEATLMPVVTVQSACAAKTQIYISELLWASGDASYHKERNLDNLRHTTPCRRLLRRCNGHWQWLPLLTSIQCDACESFQCHHSTWCTRESVVLMSLLALRNRSCCKFLLSCTLAVCLHGFWSANRCSSYHCL